MAPTSSTAVANNHHCPQSDHDSHPGSNPSTSAVDSRLECLPRELLTKIVQQCNSDKRAMRNLCLDTKHMGSVTRQVLFRKIDVVHPATLFCLYRTLREKPELGQYIVDLGLEVPFQHLAPEVFEFPQLRPYLDVIVRESPIVLTIEGRCFELLCWVYLEVLIRSHRLRKLTMMLEDHVGFPEHHTTYEPLFDKLSQAIRAARNSGSATEVLSQLEQVQLTGETLPRWPGEVSMVQAELFNTFLDLPSLSRISSINDYGVWTDWDSFIDEDGKLTSLPTHPSP